MLLTIKMCLCVASFILFLGQFIEKHDKYCPKHILYFLILFAVVLFGNLISKSFFCTRFGLSPYICKGDPGWDVNLPKLNLLGLEKPVISRLKFFRPKPIFFPEKC